MDFAPQRVYEPSLETVTDMSTMMSFPTHDVLHLLQTAYDRIEAMWDQRPDDLTTAAALTVKEFMQDRQITSPVAGLEAYVAFKSEQATLLAALGFGVDATSQGAASGARFASTAA